MFVSPSQRIVALRAEGCHGLLTVLGHDVDEKTESDPSTNLLEAQEKSSLRRLSLCAELRTLSTATKSTGSDRLQLGVNGSNLISYAEKPVLRHPVLTASAGPNVRDSRDSENAPGSPEASNSSSSNENAPASNEVYLLNPLGHSSTHSISSSSVASKTVTRAPERFSSSSENVVPERQPNEVFELKPLRRNTTPSPICKPTELKKIRILETENALLKQESTELRQQMSKMEANMATMAQSLETIQARMT